MRATSRFRRIRTSTRCTCPWVRNTQPCIHTSAASSVGPTQSPIGNLFFSSPVEGRTLPFLSFPSRNDSGSHLISSHPSFLPSPDHWRAAFASLPSNSFATRQLQPPCHGNDLCLRLYCRSEPHMINQMANSHCIHCQHCPSTRHCRHWPHMHA